MSNGFYRKSFITIFIIGLLVLGGVTFGHFKHRIDLSKLLMEKTEKNDDYSRHVKLCIISDINGGDILKMEMAIPFENMEQQIELNRKMKIIKDDILVSFGQKKMGEWVKQRNFKAIKSKYLKIINQHTDKPVEDIYFKTFNIF